MKWSQQRSWGRYASIAGLALATSVGCQGEWADRLGIGDGDGFTRIRLIADVGQTDVAHIRVRAFEGELEVAQGTSALIEGQALPGETMPSGERMGADVFLVLRPGEYEAVAEPLNQDGEPSTSCSPARSMVNVVAGATTEIVLTMVCRDAGSGALDVVGVLERPPVIANITLQPGKFVPACTPVTITVDGQDPDGDPLTYRWALLDQPAGSQAQLFGRGSSGTFTAATPGSYLVEVQIEDLAQLSSSLSFPMHVLSSAHTDCLTPPDGPTDPSDDPSPGDVQPPQD